MPHSAFAPALSAVFATAALVAVAPAALANAVDSTIKPGTQLNAISQRTTLMVLGQETHGSGSIIARQDDICVGITNAHVVEDGGQQYVVRTYDDVIHPTQRVLPLDGLDLAVLVFRCEGDYQPITLAAYTLEPGQDVYLSGWPQDASPNGDLVRQFTGGAISTILPEGQGGGYQVGYTNVTNSGMSGGQVLDQAGRLVAIHGLGATEDARAVAQRLNVPEEQAAELADTTGFNYGIPVTTLLALAQQAGLDYGFDVAFGAPRPPAGGAVADGYVYEPDANDQVNYDDVLADVNSVLQDVNDTLDTVDGIQRTFCRFTGC